MKRKLWITVLFTLLAALLISGCGPVTSSSATEEDKSKAMEQISQLQSELNNEFSSLESELNSMLPNDTSKIEMPPVNLTGYTMADVKQLKNTEHFAKKTLEHIFDGTINSKGKATGYHYTQVTDSKGEVIPGTESQKDRHSVFTAKVKVNGVKKNGFSSFYPEDWTPQQVVDAINEAYEDALKDKSNPHGELWIGYSGDLEINMYLDNSKRITTAFPIYEGA